MTAVATAPDRSDATGTAGSVRPRPRVGHRVCLGPCLETAFQCALGKSSRSAASSRVGPSR